MRFRFFTDSWYWCWNFDVLGQENAGIRSNTIKRSLFVDPMESVRPEGPDPDADAIPFYELYLKKLGHQCIPADCFPGRTFTEIVDIIIDSPLPVKNDVNVVFYSEDLRGIDLEELLVNNAHHHIDTVEQMLDVFTIENLNRLSTHAHNTDQHFLLLGGQGTIYKDIVAQCEYPERIHVVHECAVWETSKLFKPEDKPIRWKLTDINRDELDNQQSARWELMHETAVHKIDHEQASWRKWAHPYTWPDFAHPNPTTAFFITDSILHYVENNPQVVK